MWWDIVHTAITGIHPLARRELLPGWKRRVIAWWGSSCFEGSRSMPPNSYNPSHAKAHPGPKPVCGDPDVPVKDTVGHPHLHHWWCPIATITHSPKAPLPVFVGEAAPAAVPQKRPERSPRDWAAPRSPRQPRWRNFCTHECWWKKSCIHLGCIKSCE